jgi:plasmid stabilization system protein ParE
MAYKIRWSPRSVQDLEDICNYISKDSEIYARLFAKRVIVLIKTLLIFPKAGRIVPEYNNESIRERIYENYRIVYRLKGDWIELATICHAARMLKL